MISSNNIFGLLNKKIKYNIKLKKIIIPPIMELVFYVIFLCHQAYLDLYERVLILSKKIIKKKLNKIIKAKNIFSISIIFKKNLYK